MADSQRRLPLAHQRSCGENAVAAEEAVFRPYRTLTRGPPIARVAPPGQYNSRSCREDGESLTRIDFLVMSEQLLCDSVQHHATNTLTRLAQEVI